MSHDPYEKHGGISRVGAWEVADLLVDDDGSGRQGLGTFRRPHVEPPQWVRVGEDEVARMHVEASRTPVFWQGSYWKKRDGSVVAIAQLDDDHRRHIARILVDTAAAMHAARRTTQELFPVGPNDGDWDFMEPAPSWGQARDTVRTEQARGDHLDQLRATPLYRAVVAGLDDLAPGVAVREPVAAEW